MDAIIGIKVRKAKSTEPKNRKRFFLCATPFSSIPFGTKWQSTSSRKLLKKKT